MNIEVLESGCKFYESGHLHQDGKCLYESLSLEEAHKQHGDLATKHRRWCDLTQEIYLVNSRLNYIKNNPGNDAGDVKDVEDYLEGLKAQVEQLVSPKPEKNFIVVLTGQSMTEMGADRYWEVHVKATSEKEAISKVRTATRKFSIYNTNYRVVEKGTCPVGSFARLDVDGSGRIVTN